MKLGLNLRSSNFVISESAFTVLPLALIHIDRSVSMAFIICLYALVLKLVINSGQKHT